MTTAATRDIETIVSAIEWAHWKTGEKLLKPTLVIPAYKGLSQYPIRFTGIDPEWVKGIQVQAPITLTIERGALKEGKEGKYESDYWQNVKAVRAGHSAAGSPQGGGDPNRAPAARTASPEANARESLSPGQGMAWGNALTNAFGTVHGMGVDVALEDFDKLITLARAIYHATPETIHYCDTHKVYYTFQEKKGQQRHYHMEDGDYCVEGMGIVANPKKPKPVAPEPEPEEPEDVLPL